MSAGLVIQGLSAGYGRKAVVRDVTLPALRSGEVVALIGPNAAGKSTLLRAVAGLIRASGRASFDGADLIAMTLAERARHVAFMPQTLPANVSLSVHEGMLTALKAAPTGDRLSGPALHRKAFAALARFGIERLAMERFDRLSGGQRQLASLAQATVREPRLLLLDEPTSALDLAHQIRAMRLVREFAQGRDALVVVVLHDLALACRWADRVAVLANGSILSFGAPQEAISPEVLRQAYGVEARVDTDSAGRVRIEVQDALPETYRDAC